MPVDQEHYRSLISRCAFRMDAFTGSFQDLSAAQRTMTAVGAPTWGRINGLPCLSQRANADGATRAAENPLIDVTGAFVVELCAINHIAGNLSYIRHGGIGATGGWKLTWDSASERASLDLFTAAGAVARTVYSPNNSLLPRNKPFHLIMGTSLGGTTGACWVAGLPAVATLAGAGVAAAAPALALYAGGFGTGLCDSIIIRVWQGTPTNSDAQCLADAAKLLVGGW